MNTALRVLRVLALALLAAAALLALLAVYLWDHRRQIRSALVATYAALCVAAELSYSAGRWCRRQLLQAADRAAAIPAQLPTLEATREALARWVARLYPVSRHA